MREIHFSPEECLGEGALRGKGCAGVLQPAAEISVAPWHPAQATAATSTDPALFDVLLLGSALHRS